MSKKGKQAQAHEAKASPVQNPLALGLHYQLLKRAGSLISALDDVRAKLDGVGELSFPHIIVVGEESSGKSSMLERISMLKMFPRSDQMCTRMPIKLQLKHMSEEGMSQFCTSIGREYRSGEAYVRARIDEMGKSPGSWSPFLPVDGVQGLVKQNMDAAVKMRNGRLAGVVEDIAITVEVQSNRVPNLNLVDLPGVCVVPREGEPADIMERTQALVERYLRQEDTLVLLIIPCNVRIHSYVPLRLAINHNKAQQTIGVLTKADLADSRRFKDRFLELKEKLDGRSHDYVPLVHGYVAVRNSDTARPDETLETVALNEQKWFNEHLPNYVAESKASSPVLVEKLVKMMCSYVEETWVPKAKAKIGERLKELGSELASLGPPRTAGEVDRVLADFAAAANHSSNVRLLEAELNNAEAHELPRPAVGGKPYPHGAPLVKRELKSSGVRVLQEASFVHGLVVKVLSAVAHTPSMKLARFECMTDTLKAVVTAQLRKHAADSVERFETSMAQVMVLFDSDPDLQHHGSRWEASLHSRVTALLRTIIMEDVLFPLEELLLRGLRGKPSKWVSSLVEHLRQTKGCKGAESSFVKKMLVAESDSVAERRKQLNAEVQKLGEALTSIDKLRQEP